MDAANVQLKQFSSWKWKSLHDRRELLLPWLHVALIVAWLQIYISERFHSSGSVGAVFVCIVIAMSFILLHIIIVLGLVVPRYMSSSKRINWSNYQVRRVCDFLLLSIAACAVYSLHPLFQSDKTHRQFSMLCPSLLCLGISVIHHLGMGHNSAKYFLIIFVAVAFVAICLPGRGYEIFAFLFHLCAVITLFVLYYAQNGEYINQFKHSRTKKVYSWSAEQAPTEDVICAVELLGESITEIQCWLEDLYVKAGYTNNLFGVPLSEKMASMAEMQNICQMIRSIVSSGSTKPDDAYRIVDNEFLVSEVCLRVFSLFEARLGHALPLFHSSSATEVFLMGNQKTYELLIFLLLYGYCFPAGRAICFVECVAEYKQRAYINVRICTLAEQRKQRSKFPDSTTSGQAGEPVSLSGADLGSVFRQDAHHRGTSDSSLLANRNAGHGDSGGLGNQVRLMLERCADRVCLDNFQSPISFPASEIVENVAILHRRFYLPESSSFIVQGVKSLSTETFLNHQWLLIENHNSDGLGSVLRKLNVMSVPTVSIMAHQFGDINTESVPFSTVVVHEGLIAKLSKELLLEIFQCAICVVVVCDVYKSPHDIQRIYGMPVTASLSTTASLAEVFQCVQALLEKCPPRRIDLMNSSLSLAERHLSVKKMKYKSSPDQYIPPTVEYRFSTESLDHWHLLLSRVEQESIRLKDAAIVATGNVGRSIDDISNPSTSTLPSADITSGVVPANQSSSVVSSTLPVADDKLVLSSLEVCRQRLTSHVEDDWVTLARLAVKDAGDDTTESQGTPVTRDSTRRTPTVELVQHLRGPSMVAALLSKKKREVRFILQLFQPGIMSLRRLIEDKNLYEMQEMCAKLSVMSAEYGLNRLNCCFTVVQEVIDIFIALLNRIPANSTRSRLFTSSVHLKTVLSAVDEKEDVDSISGADDVSTVDSMYIRINSIVEDFVDAIEVVLWDSALTNLKA